MYQTLVIRNQRIGDAEIERIQDLIHQHWSRGRSYISKELCLLWDWRQDNGAPKNQVCRLMFRQLEDKGLIELPPRIKKGVLSKNQQYYTPPFRVPLVHKKKLYGSVGDLPGITLKPARHNQEEKLWNYLVHRYHYKSFRIIVGAHIKLIAYAGWTPVACLAYSSSVFRIRDRDRFIGWSKQQRNQNIRHVANNSRFLVLLGCR